MLIKVSRKKRKWGQAPLFYSCGCGQIYDGTFSGKIIRGDGVTAALLKRNGIKVTTEEDL